VGLGVDVIVVGGTQATRAAKEVTSAKTYAAEID
jgi:hypothetical protein